MKFKEGIINKRTFLTQWRSPLRWGFEDQTFLHNMSNFRVNLKPTGSNNEKMNLKRGNANTDTQQTNTTCIHTPVQKEPEQSPPSSPKPPSELGVTFLGQSVWGGVKHSRFSRLAASLLLCSFQLCCKIIRKSLTKCKRDDTNVFLQECDFSSVFSARRWRPTGPTAAAALTDRQSQRRWRFLPSEDGKTLQPPINIEPACRPMTPTGWLFNKSVPFLCLCGETAPLSSQGQHRQGGGGEGQVCCIC